MSIIKKIWNTRWLCILVGMGFWGLLALGYWYGLPEWVNATLGWIGLIFMFRGTRWTHSPFRKVKGDGSGG